MAKTAKKFRKPIKKKGFMSKRDVIITAILVVALAAVVTVLVKIADSDDFIRTKDGVLVMDDDWIIANYSKTGGSLYYQIGTLGAVDGFERDARYLKTPTQRLNPVDEASSVEYCMIGASAKSYVEMADYAVEFVLKEYDVAASEIYDIDLNGRNGKYVTYSTPDDDPEDETDGIFVAICYIEYSADHCVFVQLNAPAEIECGEYFKQINEQITLIPR